MNIAILEGDASIEALSERIFGATAKQRPEMTERLLELNPHLRNLKDLPPGTPIVIPVLAAADGSDQPTPDVDPRRALAIEEVVTALDGLEQRRLEQLDRRREAFEEVAKHASSDPIRQAAGADLVPLLDETINVANRGIVETDNLKSAFLEDMKRVRAILRPPRRRVVRH